MCLTELTCCELSFLKFDEGNVYTVTFFSGEPKGKSLRIGSVMIACYVAFILVVILLYYHYITSVKIIAMNALNHC